MKDIGIFVKAIKKKRELKDINTNFVKDELLKFLKKNPKLKLNINKRSKEFKTIVKGVRTVLQKVYGAYSKSKIKEHPSTKDRDYRNLYKKIFKITGKPKKILDLGCGLNPLSFKDKTVYYVACDINKNNCKIIKEHFDKLKIKNKVICKDLLKVKEKADVCFLFRVLDVIDRKGHKKSENLIKSLNCKYIVASFSTKTLSGKEMNYPYRGWIERMLERLNYKFKIIKQENEIFYVIRNIKVFS